MKKLVLLGGGYGNMRVLLRLLPNNLPLDTEIILIDRAPFHSCLLYTSDAADEEFAV